MATIDRSIDGAEVLVPVAHFDCIINASDQQGCPCIVLVLDTEVGKRHFSLCRFCVQALKDCLDSCVSQHPELMKED